MIEPSNVLEYQQMLADLHGINRESIRNPLQYHFEPEEVETLNYFRSKCVLTVGDLLLWCAFYGTYVEPGVKDFRQHVKAVFDRLKVKSNN